MNEASRLPVKGSIAGAQGRFGSLFACALLVAVMLIGFAVIGGLAFARKGIVGVAASGVAALTCTITGIIALLLAVGLRGSRYAVYGLLVGMLLRFGVPLGVATVFEAAHGPLAAAGLFGYMVVFFLLALVTETALAVHLIRRAA